MILYNLFTWVQIVQDIKNSKQITRVPSEIDRAKDILSHMDTISEVASTVKASIAGGEEETVTEVQMK